MASSKFPAKKALFEKMFKDIKDEWSKLYTKAGTIQTLKQKGLKDDILLLEKKFNDQIKKIEELKNYNQVLIKEESSSLMTPTLLSILNQYETNYKKFIEVAKMALAKLPS